jgi:serine/threonine-protein kinase
MMGTPAYMAPEQCRGLSDLDDRADVYSLGIILYEMVCGKTPFVGDQGELIAAHIYRAAPPLPPDLPGAELNDLVQRMLAKAPAQRPRMKEVATELEMLSAKIHLAMRSGPPLMPSLPPEAPRTHSTLGGASGQLQQARSGRRAVAAVALALLLCGGGVLWHRGRPAPVTALRSDPPTAVVTTAPPPPAAQVHDLAVAPDQAQSVDRAETLGPQDAQPVAKKPARSRKPAKKPEEPKDDDYVPRALQ